MQRWLGALRGLELSEEQMDQVRAISREFEAAQQAFESEHAEELRALRQARRAAEAGGTVDPELRQKLQAIEANRPKPVAYQERIWALLTPDQQDAMKVRLAEMRNDRGRQGGGERRRGDDAPDDRMTPADAMSDDAMMQPGRAGDIPSRARGDRASDDLDEAGRRRLEFLRSRQSADRPGAGPTVRERIFNFAEDEPAGDDRDRDA